MLKIYCTALLLLSFTVTFCQKKTDQDFNKLKWISGNWERVNNKAGQTGRENWERVSSSQFSGKGFTLNGADTVFIENLNLQIKGKSILYIVKMPGEITSTVFKITSVTDSSFVCENPQHDFPKKIAYFFRNKRMNATISGNGKSADFIFVKADD